MSDLKKLEEYNPAAVLIFYISVLLPVMFTTDPLLSGLSLIGACLYLSLSGEFLKDRKQLLFLLLPLLGALLNPLYNHTGETPLFFVNENPVTLESMLYGAASGLMITASLFWFRSFSRVMTSDRLLYLFGRLSPRIALILSMTLRYIPLYRKQVRKTREAVKVLGLYGEDDAFCRLKGSVRVFSVMVTWALENGVTTADSMTARGYGVGPRSFYSLFRWRREDTLLTALCLLPAAVLIAGIAGGFCSFTFFPALQGPVFGLTAVLSGGSYAFLCLLPVLLLLGEERKWKKLLSEA